MNNPVNLPEQSISIILPSHNEAKCLTNILPQLLQHYPGSEIIVVDDGSTDDTQQILANYQVRVVVHPYNKGNGAAIKSGARAANGDILIFMDADGQHQVSEIKKLLEQINQGYDLVIGSRYAKDHANLPRFLANFGYNKLASLMVGHKIPDLTSGFRAVKRKKFNQFIHLLPNGFSAPSTTTIAFYRAGFSVKFIEINVLQRIGKSHIKPIRDGIRFLLIIYKISVLYSPLKFFLPLAVLDFSLGLGYYLFTYINYTRFTNMSAMLLSFAVIIFLIGLVSEQITILIYQNTNQEDDH